MFQRDKVENHGFKPEYSTIIFKAENFVFVVKHLLSEKKSKSRLELWFKIKICYFFILRKSYFILLIKNDRMLNLWKKIQEKGFGSPKKKINSINTLDPRYDGPLKCFNANVSGMLELFWITLLNF